MMSTPMMRTMLQKAILLSLLILSACGVEGPSTDSPIIAVRVTKARQKPLSSTIGYLGTVRPAKELVLNARLQGTVAKLMVPEGTRMVAGEEMASIEAADLEALVRRLKADHEYWSKRLQEDVLLNKKGALTKDQLATSTRNAKMAEAAFTEAASRLDWQNERSPFAGHLLEWLVEPGQHLMPGQAIAVFGSLEQVVEVKVLAEDLRAGIHPGTAVSLRLSTGEGAEHFVKEVATHATGPDRSYTVTIPMEDWHGSELRSGEAIAVDFMIREVTGHTLVPEEAVITSSGNSSIYVIEENRATEVRVIEHLRSGGFVAVSPNLAPHTLVATSNLEQLKNGIEVFAVSRELNP
jgi:RND family efflux transporter MFP subunit